MNKIVQIACISFLLVTCKKNSVVPDNNNQNSDSTVFVKGADISWLTQMESSGSKFYNDSGVQQDCLVILKNKGINTVRLRAWVNPVDGWCNTKDVVVKALRAKNLGLKIMIDFHYSDVWADPGHQTKPVAWQNFSFDSLINIVYSYTFHVMDTLKQNGIVPDWVQTGNETNDGMLWEDGRASTHFNNFAKLINSGYSAIKAVDAATKVIVHISNGYDNILFRWVFDSLKFYNANWDVIGMSLYPPTNNWQNLDNQCLVNMNDMVSRYKKEVMICEVGMDVTDPADTKSFLIDIINKTKSVKGGLGVLYWEPECNSNWNGYPDGAFDNTGKPTIALDAFIN